MSERWLNCTVEEGMFSDENVIVFAVVGGQRVSFFVPKTTIRNGRVKVMVFKDDNQTWAVLPNETRSIVPVGDDAFAAA